MTCAFARKSNCTGMSTAYNGTNSIKFTFNYITSIAPKAARKTDLEGVAIRISVRRSVQVNVDVIIGNSPIRMHLYTSMYCRVSDIMLFNFDI